MLVHTAGLTFAEQCMAWSCMYCETGNFRWCSIFGISVRWREHFGKSVFRIAGMHFRCVLF